MKQRCELLIRGGWLIDPANGHDAPADLAVCAGRVVAVGAELPYQAEHVVEAANCYVVPGLIDSHVHIAAAAGARVVHRMLARAGVTTALDLAGPTAGVLAAAANHGVGLNVACIERLKPGCNLADANPSASALRDTIHGALRAGAIGVKLHYDSALTPEAAERAIAITNNMGCYVAMHCGTTASASDLTGLREAVALAGQRRLHIAHVNSYCRGTLDDPANEAVEAIRLLRGAPHLYSEAYLAAINGNWAGCAHGLPERARVRDWLRAAGYAGTQEGLRDAIRAGYARIPVATADAVVLLDGAAGVAAWEAANTQTAVSFPVNPAVSRLMLATSQQADGRFDIDALATDGGYFPRNNMVEAGLALIELAAWSRAEFVQKTSWTPARVLGLSRKGQLGPDADADIAVIDPRSRRAITTICGGKLVLHNDAVVGHGSTVLTSATGAAAVEHSGCQPYVIDLTQAGFYTGNGLKA